MIAADMDKLLEQYCQTRSPELRNRIVQSHLYIAAILARRFSGRGVEYDDLYQVASLALIKALERYDCDKGVKFASFATPNMVGEVKNYFRDHSRTIRMPRHGGELVRRMERVQATLEQRLMRSPTTEELAQELGISLEEVLEALEMRGAFHTASLDQSVQEDDKLSLQSMMGIDEGGYDAFEKRDMIRRGFAHLSELERQIIEKRYFENKSQREIARELDVSQMTVSRMERRALEQLKRFMAHETGEETI